MARTQTSLRRQQLALSVHCATARYAAWRARTRDGQAELDRYWNALLKGGGSTEACGWLKDRYGVSWQILPKVIFEMMASPDRAKSKRASDAMLKMVKLDIAALKAAFEGTS